MGGSYQCARVGSNLQSVVGRCHLTVSRHARYRLTTVRRPGIVLWLTALTWGAPASGGGWVERPATQAGVNSTTSYLQRTIFWPTSGSLDFDFWVDSEAGYDRFRLLVDGALIKDVSGVGRAGHAHVAIASGGHLIRFEYLKDSSVSVGLDTAAVDNIVARTDAGTVVGAWSFDARRKSALGWTSGGAGGGFAAGSLPVARVLQRPAAHSFLGYQPTGSSSYLDRTFTWSGSGPHKLTFKYLVDSEQNYDFLKVSVDGVLQWQVSGKQSGTQTVDVSVGTHVVRFEYYKDTSVDAGRDLALIDDVHAYSGTSSWGMSDMDGYGLASLPQGWTGGGVGGGWAIATAPPPSLQPIPTYPPSVPTVDGFVGLDAAEPWANASASALIDTTDPLGRVGTLVHQVSPQEEAVYVGARLHATTSAPGGEAGEVALLFDGARLDTLAGRSCGIGGVAPSQIDRKIVVAYATSGAAIATTTSQYVGTCGAGGAAWLAASSGELWTVSVAMSEPATDRGFIHFEARVQLRTSGGTSLLFADRLWGFGFRRIVSGVAGREVFPLLAHENLSEDDMAQMATVDLDGVIAARPAARSFPQPSFFQ